MNIFKFKKGKHIRKKKQGGGGTKNIHAAFGILNEGKGDENPLTQVSEKFDLLQELQRQRDDNNEDEGYGLNIEYITKAWKRFRPVNIEKDDNNRRRKKREIPRTKQTEIKKIFGKLFTYELMGNTHLKLYNFNEMPVQFN